MGHDEDVAVVLGVTAILAVLFCVAADTGVDLAALNTPRLLLRLSTKSSPLWSKSNLVAGRGMEGRTKTTKIQKALPGRTNLFSVQ